ncbi:SPOR domain-containing protein [Chitinibacter fontanus]|uniref:SPOR domain-containing protein n=1 Tax=Chitinibacter fontanus TaxID=1737446 RepID=A0A7D5VCN6_9NEIS|nr:SPOR domain-containing protein [Chitinibacter fontanus]QLI82913.1 SPOR domain-containing protein [Chitinibacter fontanus]
MANVSDELLQLRKRARRRLVGAIALVVFALTVLWTALDGEPPKSLLDNQTVEIISSAPALSSVVASTPIALTASAAQGVVASVASAVVEVASLPVASTDEVPASRVAPVALPGKLVNHQENAPKAVPDSSQLTPEKSGAEPSVKAAVKVSPKPQVKPTLKPSPKPTAKPNVSKAVDPKAILEGGLDKSAETKKETGKQYYIQIGAYADPEKAAQTLKKLKDAGIPARSETVTTTKGELTRVRIGPGNDEAKAKAWMQRLDALGVPGTLVVKAAQ